MTRPVTATPDRANDPRHEEAMPQTEEHPTTPPFPVTMLDSFEAFALADRDLNDLYAQHAPADPPEADVEHLSIVWWHRRDQLAALPATTLEAVQAKARALRAACAIAPGDQDDLALSLVNDLLRTS